MKVRRVAIIGSGPSGLAAAKYLEAEKVFDTIVVFEQRNTVGGLWNATPDDSSERSFSIPSVTPATEGDEPLWSTKKRKKEPAPEDYSITPIPQSSGSSSTNRSEQYPVFVSPIYDLLETNIPRSLMRFSDHSFVDQIQLFPKHQEVKRYLDEYAKDVLHLIRFQTQVVDVRLQETSVEQRDSWVVQSRRLPSNTGMVEVFDAVIVANGHYSTPYLPDVPGIKEWATAYPGSIIHSKYYRRPEEYESKKALVVGNSASGLDIASQIQPYCKQPILMSAKSKNELSGGSSNGRIELPAISSFDSKTRAIHFLDGQTESDVDAIIFCTGYLYTLPFLNSLLPPPITDGSHVEHTYQHLFYAPNPSLSFLALPQKVIPFPVAESQVSVVARVYSGRLSLPSYGQMENWDPMRELPGTRSQAAFHVLNFPKDANYINMLWDWAASAAKREGLENEGIGKMPKRWEDWEFWCRERFPLIRKAFVARGANRSKITKLEEIGFDFAEWKRDERGHEGGQMAK